MCQNLGLEPQSAVRQELPLYQVDALMACRGAPTPPTVALSILPFLAPLHTHFCRARVVENKA
jgi:hypothetical protein